jgi:excisionase family DNA binding protein
MNQINMTITKEELEKIIENAFYKFSCSEHIKEPNFITEKELSERIKISKVTLHKYRKEGRIPFSKVGRTIRYDYLKVIDALKYKN